MFYQICDQVACSLYFFIQWLIKETSCF